MRLAVLKPLCCIAAFVASSVSLGSTAAQTNDEPCEPIASATLDSKRPDWNSNGIAVSRFIAPEGALVAHGLDVSKFDERIDFLRAFECGARFAYIRLSSGPYPWTEDGWRPLWSRASTLNDPNVRSHRPGRRPFALGGYHVLSIDPIAVRRQGNVEPGDAIDQQIDLFVNRLSDAMKSLQRGAPLLPPALKLQVNGAQIRGSDTLRTQYRVSICRWFANVSAHLGMPRQALVLAVTPSAFEDLDLFNLECDADHSIPIWLMWFSKDGGYLESARPTLKSKIERLCRADDGRDRCVLHTYTENGNFGLPGGNVYVGLMRYRDVGIVAREFATAIGSLR